MHAEATCTVVTPFMISIYHLLTQNEYSVRLCAERVKDIEAWHGLLGFLVHCTRVRRMHSAMYANENNGTMAKYIVHITMDVDIFLDALLPVTYKHSKY